MKTWIADNKKLWISALIIAIVVASLGVSSAVTVTNAQKSSVVPSGVRVGEVDLGGLDVASAAEAIEAAYGDSLDDAVIALEIDGKNVSIAAKDIGARVDAEATAASALYSESGGVLSQLFSIISTSIGGRDLEKVIYIDAAAFDAALTAAASGIEQPLTPAQDALDGENIIVTNGRSGVIVDREEALEKVAKALSSERGESVVLSTRVTAPETMSAQALYDKYHCEAQDAEYIVGEGGDLTVADEIYGVDFDVTEAEKIIKQHTSDGEVFPIPVKLTAPEKLKSELIKYVFADTLSEYSTSYASSSSNRANNIELAASKINGKVLLPGEEFSYNATVGQRTTANGFQVAHAYSNGTVIDEVGGGICQVSSTLYSAALLANLRITERRNHQMTVSYVPLGQDATVNWGTQDFKFVNSTNYPIKIVLYHSGRTLIAQIKGYKEDPSLSVKLSHTTNGTIAPTVKETVDPTLAPGTSVTDQRGSTGYVVSSSRLIYRGGELVETQSLGTSRYNASATIIRKGPDAPAGGDATPVDSAPVEGSENATVPVAPEDETPTPVETAPVEEAAE